MPGLRLTDRRMLIGRVEYDYSRKTVADVTAWLTRMITHISDAIDPTIALVDERAGIVA